MIGISVDPLAASQKMADSDGINFALASDVDNAVAREYVGIDDNDLAVPGVVIVSSQGTIAFRQLSEDKADRLSAAALINIVDDVLGLSVPGAPALHGGYRTVDRLQLGLAIGGGIADSRAALRATTTLLYPLSRHLLFGAVVDGEVRTGWLAVDAALALRQPVLGDLGSLQLVLRGGRTLFALDGNHLAARTTFAFTVVPNWAIELGIDVGAHRVGIDSTVELAGTVGITRLIRVR